MPRKGLTKKLVIDAAVQMIEEKGSQAFSVNELARYLDIKPASLYNHIRNLDELAYEVKLRIVAMLRQAEKEAIEGKHRDEALLALCAACRAFAQEHKELYKINMGTHKYPSEPKKLENGEPIDPIFKVLSEYRISSEEKMHWHRIIRAMMHGFITQEYAGQFRKFPVDGNETYHIAIYAVVLAIHEAEKEEDHEQI